MPTIFIFFGFRFYSNDRDPIHVHAIKDAPCLFIAYATKSDTFAFA